MIIESELVEHNSYSTEEIVGTILQIAIKQDYIKRENLTSKGEMLLSEAEKLEPQSDLYK
jgi:hypothetical protein